MHALMAVVQNAEPRFTKHCRIPLSFYRRGIVMLRRTKVVVSFVLVAFLLMMEGTPDANSGSNLPDPIKAGVAEKLFRLDCGRSLANDESVWTPGENVGRSIDPATGRTTT